jgi:hypothetical protein
LTLSQASPVVLPNFQITNQLGKENLLSICLADNNLRAYLPESENYDDINRDFLLSVSIFIKP